MELHPEELQLSGDEEAPDPGPDDQDKGLKIRRTVTQVLRGGAERTAVALSGWGGAVRLESCDRTRSTRS